MIMSGLVNKVDSPRPLLEYGLSHSARAIKNSFPDKSTFKEDYCHHENSPAERRKPCGPRQPASVVHKDSHYLKLDGELPNNMEPVNSPETMYQKI